MSGVCCRIEIKRSNQIVGLDLLQVDAEQTMRVTGLMDQVESRWLSNSNRGFRCEDRSGIVKLLLNAGLGLVLFVICSANVSGNEPAQLSGDDNDSTLREALEMLSDDDDLELADDSDDSDDEADVAGRSLFSERETTFDNGRFSLPPIAALTTSTAEIGNGQVPLGFRKGTSSPVIPLPESGSDRSVSWQWSQSHWAAASTFSHPLYFEDRMLERHGHSRYPTLQPLLSGGRFASQLIMLPYLATINPAWECNYTLGYYRAGSCVPALRQRPPYQRKAMVAQGFSTATAFWIFP